MNVLHYTFEIRHPQYGIDYTHRYYYNCTYEEGLKVAIDDLSRGWEILNHSCYDLTIIDAKELMGRKDENIMKETTIVEFRYLYHSKLHNLSMENKWLTKRGAKTAMGKFFNKYPARTDHLRIQDLQELAEAIIKYSDPEICGELDVCGVMCKLNEACSVSYREIPKIEPDC